MWVAQLRGYNSIRFEPKEPCDKTCSVLEDIIEEGEIGMRLNMSSNSSLLMNLYTFYFVPLFLVTLINYHFIHIFSNWNLRYLYKKLLKMKCKKFLNIKDARRNFI